MGWVEKSGERNEARRVRKREECVKDRRSKGRRSRKEKGTCEVPTINDMYAAPCYYSFCKVENIMGKRWDVVGRVDVKGWKGGGASRWMGMRKGIQKRR